MKNRITVFTPTYNREKSLHRVYESLVKQTYKNFIWLIIDDGSKDNTKELINKYKKEKKIEIKYIYQENQGKHIAVNNAIKITNTELFIIADSDDAFVPEALEVFVDEWDKIENKEKYKGIIARCYDHDTGAIIGEKWPSNRFDANELDANFKLHTTGEKWSLFKTEVLREFPFPEIKGLKFYPETILWQKIARKYKTRYIDVPLREYYKDQSNSLTGKKNSRHKENIFLWEHIINNTMDYFWYNPKLFIKAFIGITRDGKLCGMKELNIIKKGNRFYKSLLIALFSPFGFILYINKK